MTDYRFDRYLRFDELTTWLHETAAAHPSVMTVETYGRSHEGRDLWLVTITDAASGPHDSKPAHWIDANIHSTEVTAGVAALAVIDHLVNGFGSDPLVTRAVQTRTFYIVPRVNPDGVEWALADSPQYRRSSVRAWPWSDAHRAPGLHVRDIDGDGRVLTMRIADPNGAWMTSSLDPRLLAPVPADGTDPSVQRYRLLREGEVVDHDGFTVPTPRPPQGLDMNRNFPAGWGTSVPGSGDHPLSEPEIDALVRAIAARPNICGYNAFHTSGGVLLRPSSTLADSALPPMDVWTWTELGRRGTELTGYGVHSVFEDFTWDTTDTMSGASDDWAYEHLGIYGWTTEFWDVIAAATGAKQSTKFWYTGPTEAEEHAVLAWADVHRHSMFVPWYRFDHPQFGEVELGGWDEMCTWTNPPLSLLAAEVAGHGEFAVHQALAAPELEIVHTAVVALGADAWRVEVGIANTGWLPTTVTERARKNDIVLPITAHIAAAVAGGDAGGDAGVDAGAEAGPVTVLGGSARHELGQLAGRLQARFTDRHDGTPDRVLATWVIRAARGTEVTVVAAHPRAGRSSITITLG